MIAYAPFQSIADRGTVASLQAGVIVDTQVLIDFAVRTRRRHGLALRFFQHIQATSTPVLIPGHAVFEIQSAFQAAMRERQAQLAPQARIRNINNVILHPVAVDQALVAAYKRLKLPYLRAGDRAA